MLTEKRQTLSFLIQGCTIALILIYQIGTPMSRVLETLFK